MYNGENISSRWPKQNIYMRLEILFRAISNLLLSLLNFSLLATTSQLTLIFAGWHSNINQFQSSRKSRKIILSDCKSVK
jgi:hypothetical protein